MTATMTETTWREIRVTGADWRTVVAAFTPGADFAPGYANIGADWRPRVYAAMEAAGVWDEQLADSDLYHHLADQVILSAVGPGFGAGRSFELIQGGTAPVIPDELGGWHILEERSTTYVYAESGTSGSSVTARRESGRGLPSRWTLTGCFPVENGEVYKGLYYATFAAAAGLTPGVVA